MLAVLLAVNAVTTSSQTKEAESTVEGGQILALSSGDVQVTDSGEADGQPIVLLHGYAARFTGSTRSSRSWQRTTG